MRGYGRSSAASTKTKLAKKNMAKAAVLVITGSNDWRQSWKTKCCQFFGVLWRKGTISATFIIRVTTWWLQFLMENYWEKKGYFDWDFVRGEHPMNVGGRNRLIERLPALCFSFSAHKPFLWEWWMDLQTEHLLEMFANYWTEEVNKCILDPSASW